MKMIAYYSTLQFFTSTYPNLLKGQGMLPDLQNGDSLISNPHEFFILPLTGISTAGIGSTKYATTIPFTPVYGTNELYSYVTVTEDIGWSSVTGTVTDYDLIFTLNTHLKIRMVI